MELYWDSTDPVESIYSNSYAYNQLKKAEKANEEKKAFDEELNKLSPKERAERELKAKLNTML